MSLVPIKHQLAVSSFLHNIEVRWNSFAARTRQSDDRGLDGSPARRRNAVFRGVDGIAGLLSREKSQEKVHHRTALRHIAAGEEIAGTKKMKNLGIDVEVSSRPLANLGWESADRSGGGDRFHFPACVQKQRSAR